MQKPWTAVPKNAVPKKRVSNRMRLKLIWENWSSSINCIRSPRNRVNWAQAKRIHHHHRRRRHRHQVKKRKVSINRTVVIHTDLIRPKNLLHHHHHHRIHRTNMDETKVENHQIIPHHQQKSINRCLRPKSRPKKWKHPLLIQILTLNRSSKNQ